MQTTLKVDGMTCGHCAKAVTEELTAIDGIQDVQIDLVNGGRSTVTFTSADAVPQEALNAAVTEAGYTLAEVTNA